MGFPNGTQGGGPPSIPALRDLSLDMTPWRSPSSSSHNGWPQRSAGTWLTSKRSASLWTRPARRVAVARSRCSSPASTFSVPFSATLDPGSVFVLQEKERREAGEEEGEGGST